MHGVREREGKDCASVWTADCPAGPPEPLEVSDVINPLQWKQKHEMSRDKIL